MIKAISISKTSVSIYQTTRCIISEDNRVHTHHSENLKSHPFFCGLLKDTVSSSVSRVAQSI
jgi:hypothetical protein